MAPQINQEIKKNDPVVTIESDKSSVEIPSSIEGKIEKIEVKVGDKVVLPTQGFTKLPFDGEEYYIGPENQVLAKVEATVSVEDALAETVVNRKDINDLTDI